MAATANTAGMDALRLLVQHVARSFYDPKYIILMDQLARSQVIKDDDLAGRMGLQAKEVNKLTAVLVNDRLVKVYRRNELKEGASRAVGRQYYYIDYKHFCDVVKWRIAEMRRLIDKDLRSDMDTKGYICPQCGAQYTPLDASRLVDFSTGGFHCEICRAELEDNENADNVKGSNDRMQRFNRQMTNIREGLRKSEEMVLPAFDIEAWVRLHYTETEREQEEESDGLKIAGGRHGGPEAVGVVMNMEQDEDARRAERARMAEEKRQQNQMPSWHLKSTISGELTALGVQYAQREAEQHSQHVLDSLSGLPPPTPTEPQSNGNVIIEGLINGQRLDVKPKLNVQSDVYDAYYARLQAGPSKPKSDADSASEEEDVKPSIWELDARARTISSTSKKRSRSRSPHLNGGEREAKFLRTPSGARSASASAPPTTATNTPEAANGGGGDDDPLVFVNGAQMRYSEVMDDHHDMMTPDEYTAYFEIYSKKNM